MKKNIVSILIIMIFAIQSHAGITLFGMKADLWNKFTKTDKLMYLQGVFDGLVFANFTIHETKISTNLSITQYISAMDEFYSDYRNALIPTPFVLKIITLEVNGVSQDEISDTTQNYRKQFSK